MGTFLISHDDGIVVNWRDDERHQMHPICNFGDRQSDAIEFRDDCQNDVFPAARIRILIKMYTSQRKFKYTAKRQLEKQY